METDFCVKTSKKKVYSPEELATIQAKLIPEHVAIIMDGNRRWAKMNGVSSAKGHWQGAETLTKIVRAASELGIKVLTVFAFSTENWARSSKEIQTLMRLFEFYLLKQKKTLQKEKVRLSVIGDLSKFPQKVKKAFLTTQDATKSGTNLDLVLALNYGSRNEIVRAVKKILIDFEEKKIKKETLSEELFSKYLDTAAWKDPDLLIRTSGEQRLSNFLLWQASYAEICIFDVLWPDFTEKHLYEAVLQFQKRERRLGGGIL
jgi:undecaprenyl diphosphate synthase